MGAGSREPIGVPCARCGTLMARTPALPRRPPDRVRRCVRTGSSALPRRLCRVDLPQRPHRPRCHRRFVIPSTMSAVGPRSASRRLDASTFVTGTCSRDSSDPPRVRIPAQSRPDIECLSRGHSSYSEMCITTNDSAARHCAQVEARAFPGRLRRSTIHTPTPLAPTTASGPSPGSFLRRLPNCSNRKPCATR